MSEIILEKFQLEDIVKRVYNEFEIANVFKNKHKGE